MDIMSQSDVWNDMNLMQQNDILQAQVRILAKFLDEAYPTCPPDDHKTCTERKNCFECWEKWSFEKAKLKGNP